jgi:hypothetical protein
MTPLNDKQRKFLEYLRDAHKSITYPLTIQRMLLVGRYEDGDAKCIIQEFYKLRTMPAYQSVFGIPTKYLK